MLSSSLIFPVITPYLSSSPPLLTHHLTHYTLHVCLCQKVTICPSSVATFCHPLACFMISQGPPTWTASAHLASSRSRWIQPKEGTCRSLAGRKTKMAGFVFPTSFLPAWPFLPSSAQACSRGPGCCPRASGMPQRELEVLTHMIMGPPLMPTQFLGRREMGEEMCSVSSDAFIQSLIPFFLNKASSALTGSDF